MDETDEGKITGKQILAATLILIILLSMIIPATFSVSSSLPIGLIFIILLVGIAFAIILFAIVRIKNNQNKKKNALFKEYLNENLKEVKILENGPIKNCQICKLEIKLEHIATVCPKCRNFFHKEHLIIWLVQNSHCPVCNYDFNYKMPKKRIN